MLDRVQGRAVSLDVAVTVRDMSLGGMSIETAFPFPDGATHEFSLTLGDGSTVVLRGRAVRSRTATGEDGSVRYITGIQFVEDDAEDGSGPVGGFIDKAKD
jgi:hypothetical protein